MENAGVKCKYCGTESVAKYGRVRGVQRWWCKECRRKFTHPESIPGMIASIEVVSQSMEMYNKGESLRAISKHLEKNHNYWVSESTLYQWVIRFSKLAIDRVAECKPLVGDVWILYERNISICGREIVFWDILDSKTGVLLASQISGNVSAQDALDLYAKAINTSQKRPTLFLVDDQLNRRNCSQTLARTNDVKISSFVDGHVIDLIDNFRYALESRDRVLGSLKKMETLQLLVDGWQVHYNYFRPSRLLDGRTPAEEAGIKLDIASVRSMRERYLKQDKQEMGANTLSFFNEKIEQKFREMQQTEPSPEPKAPSHLSWTDGMLLFALADKLTDEDTL